MKEKTTDEILENVLHSSDSSPVHFNVGLKLPMCSTTTYPGLRAATLQVRLLSKGTAQKAQDFHFLHNQ